MNRKEINTISVLILIVLILILLQKKLKINNSILDFLLICAIIITGRKYLKIAILLTFLLFIIKTNNSKINEGFIDNIDEDEEKEHDDNSDEDDKEHDDNSDEDNSDEDDIREPEKKAIEEDTEPETKTNKEANDHSEPEQDVGTLYEDDCNKKCKKSNKSDSECRDICSVICPNPIKYNHDLKELNKLKRIMKELENQ